MMLTRCTAAGAVTLLFGLATLGCSGSSGSGGSAATTASSTSGSTSSTGSGSTSTSTTPPNPQAPASQGQPLTVFNQDIQDAWTKLLPTILAKLNYLASTQLQNARYTSSTVSVEFRNLRIGPATNMQTAPGFLRLDTKGLQLRAPATGTWTLALDADIRVTLNVGGFSPSIDLPITLRLEDLSLELQLELDDSDPTPPALTRVGQPQINFTLHLDSSNSIVGRLTGVLNQPANWLAQQAMTLAMAYIAPTLNNMQGIPGPIPGDGAAPLTDSGVATPFQEVADNVSFKARQINMPYGPVLAANMDTPATDSWLDAYKNGGPGVQGQVTGYEVGGDSAIWTGHTLAAEAFRYAVTGSSLALDNVGHLLGGVGKLLDVNGGTGLLARSAAPEATPQGQRLVRDGVYGRAQINGQSWVGVQGGGGISRDQYSGVMFGLAITWELVPQARPECEYRINMILNYLMSHDWYIDEDRPVAFNPSNPTQKLEGPTFWVGVVSQRLAFLLIGHRFDPARYGPELAKLGPLSETAWIGAWTGTMGVDHYYKFNLGHIAAYNYFRLETDPTRWQDMRRANMIDERYTGHHRNAHFDLIQSSIDPAKQTTLFPSIREALRQFLRQNHREVAPPVVDLSGVTWVNLQQFGYQNTPSGGITFSGTTRRFPTEPLDVELRRPSGHFQWQRSPFDPAIPNQGNPRREKIGLDLLLPYWMGRYMGAF